jgi:hypothetical protein
MKKSKFEHVFLAFLVILAVIYLLCGYISLLKYYPNLTIWEYFVNYNQLRIVPK